MPSPPCRVCGKPDGVLEYPSDSPAAAICPDCCAKAEHEDGETGHQFEYNRDERDHVCKYCGLSRRCTDHYESD